jgi:hypothetical protein
MSLPRTYKPPWGSEPGPSKEVAESTPVLNKRVRSRAGSKRLEPTRDRG